MRALTVTQLLKIQTNKAGKESNQKRRKNGVKEKTTKSVQKPSN
jgi:hypothetical protein